MASINALTVLLIWLYTSNRHDCCPEAYCCKEGASLRKPLRVTTTQSNVGHRLHVSSCMLPLGCVIERGFISTTSPLQDFQAQLSTPARELQNCIQDMFFQFFFDFSSIQVTFKKYLIKSYLFVLYYVCYVLFETNLLMQ